MNRKRALVTGAGVGIGRGIAVELGKAGYDVAVHYFSSPAGAEETCRQVEAAGGRARMIQGDLSKTADIRRLFEEAAAFLGGLDLYVNNSGVTLISPFEETTEEIFDRLVSVDFKSAYFCVQTAAAVMSRSGIRGNIVIISSSNAFQQLPGASVYGSIKAALCKLTRHAAAEYAKYGIRVNCIAPGWTATPRTLEKDQHSTDALIPLKRWALPEEIGQMVLFYASPAAGSVTGNILLADGGATLLSKPAADYGL